MVRQIARSRRGAVVEHAIAAGMESLRISQTQSCLLSASDTLTQFFTGQQPYGNQQGYGGHPQQQQGYGAPPAPSYGGEYQSQGSYGPPQQGGFQHGSQAPYGEQGQYGQQHGQYAQGQQQDYNQGGPWGMSRFIESHSGRPMADMCPGQGPPPSGDPRNPYGYDRDPADPNNPQEGERGFGGE